MVGVNNKIHNQGKIPVIVVTMVLVLTLGTTGQSQQSIAFSIHELGDFKGLSDMELSNNCVAFECNNQQTVDNRKTISDNTNSNIISESDNANIDTSVSTNQPGGNSPPLTCVQCFENANLTQEQKTDLFSIIPGQPNSYAELCPLIQNSSAADFELALIEGAFLTEAQAKSLVNCLVEAGILVD